MTAVSGLDLMAVVVAVVFFMLPGWLGVSALRVSGRGPAGLILSTLTLFWSVMVVLALGLPLRFGPVLVMQVLVSGIVFALLVKQGRGRAVLPRRFQSRGVSFEMLVLVAAISLVGCVLVIRLLVQPLMGFDCPVRWDLMARQMLSLEGLDFYPPITAQDFRVYTFPDSIAPLVSGVFWWLYAAAGQANERLTSLFVAAQGVAIGAFVYLLGRRLASNRAGVIALSILASAPLAFSSLVIGQETGLTTIALLGVVYFLDPQGEGGPRLEAVVMAGFAVALGALAREYGWAFLPLGWVLLWRQRAAFRMYVAFSVVVLAVAFPWYLKTWVLTGNPLYSLRLGTLFPVNPIYTLYLEKFSSVQGISTYSIQRWLGLGGTLVRQAPIQVLAFFMCFSDKRYRSLWLGSGLMVALWIISISFTMGGAEYSLRVLGPAVALLSVGAGVLIDRLQTSRLKVASPNSRLSWMLTVVLVGMILRALIFDALFPHPPESIPPQDWFRHTIQTKQYQYRCEGVAEEVSAFLDLGVRVLTHDSYTHVGLMGSDNPSVLVWSPEVSYLFDFTLGGEEIRRRLLQEGIGAVVYLPPDKNDPMLELSHFFRGDRKHWVVLGPAAQNKVLYLLPP